MRLSRWLLAVALVLSGAISAQAQNQAIVSGNLRALNDCVIMPVQAMGTASVQLVGTWTGTVSFSVANTGDPADYVPVNMYAPNASTAVTTSTANGLWTGSVAGLRFFKACMTSAATGAAGVLLSAAGTGGGGTSAANVNLSGSTFSGNSAASNTGAAVPAAAGYTGINIGGTLTGLTAGQATMAASLPVTLASNQTALTVSPSNTANTTAWLVTGTGGTFPAAQSGTWNITNVSGTVTLPTGASTAAKQPALGTGGTASTDVLTVQGIAGMTPLLVTNTGVSSIRLQDGGGNNLTSLADGAQRALTVSVVDNAGNQISSFGGSGGTSSAFGAAFPSGASSGSAVGFNDGVNMQAARVVDLDTGAGTFYGLTTNSVFRASGGPIEAGTSANPWNVVFPSAQAVTGPATDTQMRASPIPISGTVTATGPLTDTQLRASAVPVSVASLPSQNVTNVGTFATQVTALPALPTGANVIGSLTANQTVNVAQINGVAPLMGAGVNGTGAQRVTIATDQAALPITVATIPTHAVTSTGTFSVQVTSMPADATELPAASVLTDAFANPTTPVVGAAMMGWNGATWDRLQPALDYAQNSTTTGQTGPLTQGAVTTSAPTYTSGRTSPISLDTSGSVRVAVVSGSTGNAAAGNTGSAIPTQADYTGVNVGGTMRGMTGVNPSGTIYAGQVDMSAVAGATTSVNNGVVDAGTLRVTLASNSSGVVGLATGANVIGALAANQSINNAQINGVAPLMGNGISGTGAQRVTIASDSTGVLGATQSGTWTMQPGNTANTTAWLIAGGKTTNTAVPGATNLGVLAGLANASAPSFTEGNQVLLSTDLAGNLRVTGGGGGTQYTQNVALTVASTIGTMAMGRASAAAPTDVAADNNGVLPWYLRSGAQAMQQTYAGVLATTGNGVTGTGTPRVTLASDSTGQVTLAAGAATIGALTANQSVNVAQINGVTALMGNGVSGTGAQRVTIASDSTGQIALAASTAVAGYFSEAATATTTNSVLECAVVSAASNNAAFCKASAGNFYGIDFYNTTTTTYYLRLYNLTAAPTCSSATGFVRSIPIPPAGAAGQTGGVVRISTLPVGYSTGIAYCLTGGAAGTDNTNAAVGLFGAIAYK